MTSEEIRARAIEAEKRKKREYYLANREKIIEKMKEYGRTHRAQMLPREKAWREKNAVRYFDTQVKYWTRKTAEEPGNKRCGYMLRYYTKKLNKAKEN